MLYGYQNWAVLQRVTSFLQCLESDIPHCPDFIWIPCHLRGRHGVTGSRPGPKSNSLASVRDPPDSRNGSPSLGHSLNPSLSAAAIKSGSQTGEVCLEGFVPEGCLPERVRVRKASWQKGLGSLLAFYFLLRTLIKCIPATSQMSCFDTIWICNSNSILSRGPQYLYNMNIYVISPANIAFFAAWDAGLKRPNLRLDWNQAVLFTKKIPPPSSSNCSGGPGYNLNPSLTGWR